MLNSIKQTGRNIGRELSHAWSNLSSGWHELLSRSSNALTHFTQGKGDDQSDSVGGDTFPNWSLLAGELEETDKDVVVRLEWPGMDKADCQVILDGNTLYVSGEKHSERETNDSTYHVMERAYGFFQRAIPLPRNVTLNDAHARLKNGVLTVRLPKATGASDRSHSIRVT
jgi:HSP20 family protein